MKRVFIASPYINGDLETNVRRLSGGGNSEDPDQTVMFE